MRDIEHIEAAQILSGRLLLAHPTLKDPNFIRSVILLSAHNEDDGAMGVVINRPTGKTLSQIDERFILGALSEVPVYYGGPVSDDQLILAAWSCNKETGVFKLYFGINEEKAQDILQDDPEANVRGYLGYAGWTGGQLEGELEQDAWVIAKIDVDLIDRYEDAELWRLLMQNASPELGFLADEPEDPSVN